MENIILDLNSPNGKLLNLSALYEELSELKDTRSAHGKVYPLRFVLITVILAKFSGQNKPSAIAEWIKGRREMLVNLFNCRHNRVPCLNTIRTILSEVISLDELEKLLRTHLLKQYGGGRSELISVDGKTMKGTIPAEERRGVHLLAAYLPEEGVVLAQVPVDEKKNEISMSAQLFEKIDLKNRVVCADALLTQRTVSTDILSRGGHYIWFLKENQPSVALDVAQFFQPPRQVPGWHAKSMTYQLAETVDKGHGRLERRQITTTTNLHGFIDWPGLAQVFKLERTVRDLSGAKISQETVYGITSCPQETHSADQLLTLIRSYWGIENGLHYRRDVTLEEDQTRVSHTRFASVIATINNFVVSMTQKLDFSNMASALRRFDASFTSFLVQSAK